MDPIISMRGSRGGKEGSDTLCETHLLSTTPLPLPQTPLQPSANPSHSLQHLYPHARHSSSSAIWMAFRAAPFFTWSPHTHRFRPRASSRL